MTQQDRKCTLNVTLRHFRETITYSVCEYSLMYTACNAHAPYYTYIVICAVFDPNVFFNIIS
jgi:hypothetical protein